MLYKRSLRRHVIPGHRTYLSLDRHRHCLDPGQRPLRRPEALKAEHRPGQALDPAVVLLDPVIEPAPPPMPGEAPQLAFLLHLAQRAGIALEAVGDDLARVAGVLAAEGTLEEALRRLLVPLGAEQKVDRLAGAVDGPVQVAPLPADPDVRLIDVPRPAAGAQVAAHPLLQLRGEALDPAVHGRVIHCDAAIGEHSLQIAIADRELQVPAHRPQDHLGREAKAAECSGGVGHERYSRRDVGGSTAPTWARCPAQCNRSRCRTSRQVSAITPTAGGQSYAHGFRCRGRHLQNLRFIHESDTTTYKRQTMPYLGKLRTAIQAVKDTVFQAHPTIGNELRIAIAVHALMGIVHFKEE